MTFYLKCHDFIQNEGNNCNHFDAGDNGTYTGIAQAYLVGKNWDFTRGVIVLFGSIIGLVNNNLSLYIVNEYRLRGRIITEILRLLYWSHIITAAGALVHAFTVISVDVKNNPFVFGIDVRVLLFQSALNPASFSLRMSDGLLAFTSLLIYKNSSRPYFVRSSEVMYYIAYLIISLFGLVNICIPLHTYIHGETFETQKTLSAFYDLIAIGIILFFNAMRVLEQCVKGGGLRNFKTTKNQAIRMMGLRNRTLFQYAQISSTVFVLTAAPVTIIHLLPHMAQTLSCQLCYYIVLLEQYSNLIRVYATISDNVAYCIFSNQYRHELYHALKILACGRDFMPQVSLNIVVPAE